MEEVVPVLLPELWTAASRGQVEKVRASVFRTLLFQAVLLTDWSAFRLFLPACLCFFLPACLPLKSLLGMVGPQLAELMFQFGNLQGLAATHWLTDVNLFGGVCVGVRVVGIAEQTIAVRDFDIQLAPLGVSRVSEELHLPFHPLRIDCVASLAGSLPTFLHLRVLRWHEKIFPKEILGHLYERLYQLFLVLRNLQLHPPGERTCSSQSAHRPCFSDLDKLRPAHRRRQKALPCSSSPCTSPTIHLVVTAPLESPFRTF
mmetsp:Transcript_66647/g.159015  ORF Transcript_66647/g.159015 Transcript_66647/m.159015 type:complete len:259 (-) Transcript_66647:125-901(-)